MVIETIYEYREILKVVYALAIIFICSIIFLKSDRLFKISDYQGLRYFRNAFLFYGLGFFFSFILLSLNDPMPYFPGSFALIVSNLGEFFLLLASFFLLYSLIWKRVEKEKNFHSLFNIKMLLAYLGSLIIIFIDNLLSIGIFELFQIFLFLSMSIITFNTYSKNKFRNSSYRNYFLIIVIGLLSTLINYVSIINPAVGRSYVYILNSVFFFFFFYFSYKAARN